VATWAGRWALGAAGAVEVDENPVETLARELEEEWSVAPERLSAEALIELPTHMVMLVGTAWLAPGATVTPDAEHDEYAWWPPDPAQWPAVADAPLLRTAALLAG
jgi:8-oxo-dGTP diphosphatase